MKDYLVIYGRAEDGAWGAHSPDVEGVFAVGVSP
jgi:predicted RNase H-like HicB family nuclease